jgi:hypothetical protein
MKKIRRSTALISLPNPVCRLTSKRDELYDLTFGVHSNIPLCCAVYYVTKWRDASHLHRMRMLNCFDGWDYIPCPSCFRSKRSRPLHLCGPNCRDFLAHTLCMSQKRVDLLCKARAEPA